MKPTNFYLQAQQSLDQAWIDYQKLFRKVRKRASRREVHDLRNAIQRLGATLEISSQLRPFAESQKLIQEIRQERKILGPLRNAQVELQLLKPYKDSALYHFIEKKQKKAQKKVLKKMNRISLKSQKEKIREMSQKLGKESAGPVREETLRRLESELLSKERHFERMLPVSERGSAKKLHQLRITAKQILYQSEVFHKLTGHNKLDLQKYEQIHQLVGDLRNEVLLLKVLDKFLKKKKHASDSIALNLQTDLKVDRQNLTEEAEKSLRKTQWHH